MPQAQSDPSLEARLEALEQESRLLEEDPRTRRELATEVLSATHKMLDNLEGRRAWAPVF